VGRGETTGSRRVGLEDGTSSVIDGRGCSDEGKEGNWERIHDCYMGF